MPATVQDLVDSIETLKSNMENFKDEIGETKQTVSESQSEAEAILDGAGMNVANEVSERFQEAGEAINNAIDKIDIAIDACKRWLESH